MTRLVLKELILLNFLDKGEVETQPSPTIGQHNTEIYGGWLGLSAGEIATLSASGVI